MLLKETRVVVIYVAFWTASYDGRVIQWRGNYENSKYTKLQNNTLYAHTNQVTGLVAHKNGVLSVGMDDQLISTQSNVELQSTELPKVAINKVKIQGLAKGLTIVNNTAIVASTNALQAVKLPELQCTVLKKGEYTCVAASSKYVVVGLDAAAIVYPISILTNPSVEPICSFTVKGKVTCCLITPDDCFIATGSSERQVALHEIASKTTIVDQWVFHSSKVTAISCSPEKIEDQWFIASGAVDGIVMVNKPLKPLEPKKVQPAHLEGVNCVQWLNTFTRKVPDPKNKDAQVQETVAVVKSTGGDASVKVWEIVL